MGFEKRWERKGVVVEKVWRHGRMGGGRYTREVMGDGRDFGNGVGWCVGYLVLNFNLSEHRKKSKRDVTRITVKDERRDQNVFEHRINSLILMDEDQRENCKVRLGVKFWHVLK